MIFNVVWVCMCFGLDLKKFPVFTADAIKNDKKNKIMQRCVQLPAPSQACEQRSFDEQGTRIHRRAAAETGTAANMSRDQIRGTNTI